MTLLSGVKRPPKVFWHIVSWLSLAKLRTFYWFSVNANEGEIYSRFLAGILYVAKKSFKYLFSAVRPRLSSFRMINWNCFFGGFSETPSNILDRITTPHLIVWILFASSKATTILRLTYFLLSLWLWNRSNFLLFTISYWWKRILTLKAYQDHKHQFKFANL